MGTIKVKIQASGTPMVEYDNKLYKPEVLMSECKAEIAKLQNEMGKVKIAVQTNAANMGTGENDADNELIETEFNNGLADMVKLKGKVKSQESIIAEVESIGGLMIKENCKGTINKTLIKAALIEQLHEQLKTLFASESGFEACTRITWKNDGFKIDTYFPAGSNKWLEKSLAEPEPDQKAKEPTDAEIKAALNKAQLDKLKDGEEPAMA